ncbi:hypothetical protein [Olsenella sp. HMSC062G07]|uniref:hypothetical protein n=1 Tax=Olsenella sp. HMSC062G07 TaxID=1739330 RepID=UPI0008A3B7E6|nr:hypothetical protein [Olsenella sp. HMSC062G07]OFK23569.1 hypothetical protein HMPREF2826_04705 [Olsenella sp. HMSC062G07]
MQVDSLVHIPAAGGYGSVMGLGEDGSVEVELIDPGADDFSLRLPLANVGELEHARDADLEALARSLALLHLRVSRALDLDRSFDLYVGRTEDAALDLWFGGGRRRPRRLRTLSAAEGEALASTLAKLALDAWRHGGPREDTRTLDGWGWSCEVIGGGRGASGFGRQRPFEGMEGLCDVLMRLGAPIGWEDDAPGAVPRAL